MLVAELRGFSYHPYPTSSGKLGRPQQRGSREFHVFSTGKKSIYDATFPCREVSIKKVFAVRDPRDAIVSQYFSWRNSHKNNTNTMLEWRERLSQVEVREGIYQLICEGKFPYMNQLCKWTNVISSDDSAYILKYEDLLLDFRTHINDVMHWLNIDLSNKEIEYIFEKTNFETKTNRFAGIEDQKSHFRKGISGDHKRFFDEKLRKVFDQRYDRAMIILGYI